MKRAILLLSLLGCLAVTGCTPNSTTTNNNSGSTIGDVLAGLGGDVSNLVNGNANSTNPTGSQGDGTGSADAEADGVLNGTNEPNSGDEGDTGDGND